MLQFARTSLYLSPRKAKKIPIVCQSSLKMSPSLTRLKCPLLLMMSVECVLKRSPVVRAKRKYAFHRAELRAHGSARPAFPYSPAARDGLAWLFALIWLAAVGRLAGGSWVTRVARFSRSALRGSTTSCFRLPTRTPRLCFSSVPYRRSWGCNCSQRPLWRTTQSLLMLRSVSSRKISRSSRCVGLRP